MSNCFRCGRPLEDENEEVCVSCKNLNNKTGISLKPWSVLWFLSIFLLIPLIIYTKLSNNYILCLWLLIPEVFLLSITSCFRLKYYNLGNSRYIHITDIGFKVGVISIIVAGILALVAIIIFLVNIYNHMG